MVSSPFLWYRFVLAAFRPKFTEKCFVGEEEGDNENRCLVTIFTCCDQVMDVGKRFLESMMSSNCVTKLHQDDCTITLKLFLHIWFLKLPIDKLLSAHREMCIIIKSAKSAKWIGVSRVDAYCSTYTSMCVPRVPCLLWKTKFQFRFGFYCTKAGLAVQQIHCCCGTPVSISNRCSRAMYTCVYIPSSSYVLLSYMWNMF